MVRKGGQISGQKRRLKLTEREKNLLEVIKEKPAISRKELSEALGINPSAVQKHIQKLKERDLLRRIGPDKGGHWEILK